MGRFFNSENWLWQGFGRIADYFILSILWLVCSIPVITVGAASIALYDTVAHCFRFGEGNMFQRFFSTFRRELGRGIVLTILWALIGWLLNVGYQVLTQLGADNQVWNVLSIVYFVSLFLPLGVGCWAIALQSRFTNTLGQLHKNAFALTLAYLPRTVIIVALLVLVLNLLYNFLFFIIFVPALMVNFQSMVIEKVFKKYMPEEEE